jgi:hypothetical protein
VWVRLSAPGRNRTLNRPGRNRLLYPLSYGRQAQVSQRLSRAFAPLGAAFVEFLLGERPYGEGVLELADGVIAIGVAPALGGFEFAVSD